MRVNDSSYVCIQAFMVNELHLSGNELVIYACIYGFSQDGESWFTGSRSYLASWCQASKSTVSRNLEKLCNAGLIEKRVRVENGVTLADYRADYPTQNGTGGVPKMGRGGVPKMSTHNIEKDNIDSKKKERSYEAAINAYTENVNLRSELIEFVKMRKLARKPLTDRALSLLLNKLDSLASDDEGKTAVVSQSIERGWQGFFEIKDKPKDKPTYKPTDESDWDFE